MVWAVLARFLLRKPAWIQAVVLGLCTGLFVTTAAEANDRDPKISSALVLVLASGTVSALLYYSAYRMRTRTGAEAEAEADQAAPGWLYADSAAVWVFGLVAAMTALLGEGGLKVAGLAVVPLVLVAPIAG